MEARAHEVLSTARALGLGYVDCARSYGLSERFVASWPELTDAMVVGSKWGYEYTAGWRVQVDEGEVHEVKAHTDVQLARQLRESRQLLPLSLYQIHSATEDSGVLDNEAVLEALAELRDAPAAEGAPRCAVGLSVSHPQV